MFGYKYKMEIVNPTKGIIKIRPTAGTWMKAFAPLILIYGVFALVFLSTKDDEPISVLDILAQEDALPEDK